MLGISRILAGEWEAEGSCPVLGFLHLRFDMGDRGCLSRLMTSLRDHIMYYAIIGVVGCIGASQSAASLYDPWCFGYL